MHYRFVLRHGRRTDDQPGRGGAVEGVSRERVRESERERRRREWLKDKGGGGAAGGPEPMRAK